MPCQREIAAERNEGRHDERDPPGFASPIESKPYGRQPEADLELGPPQRGGRAPEGGVDGGHERFESGHARLNSPGGLVISWAARLARVDGVVRGYR